MHNTTPVMYTEEYQVDYYKENLKAFDEFPCVVGEQVWNFADFATSQSLLRVEGNKKGLFTRDRKTQARCPLVPPALARDSGFWL